LYFFSFNRKSGVDFECKLWNFIHWFFKNFESIINSTDIILHLTDSIDTTDKFAIIFKDKGLDLMIMYFYLLVDLIVTADQLADWILFEHAHNIAFGIEIWGVYVHGKGGRLKILIGIYLN